MTDAVPCGRRRQADARRRASAWRSRRGSAGCGSRCRWTRPGPGSRAGSRPSCAGLRS